MNPKPTVRLDSVCRILQGGRQKLSGKHFIQEGGFPAYGAGGHNGNLPSYEFDEPAIVLSAIGARCGKCFQPSGKWSSLANTSVFFPDKSKADIRFLWYQLNDEESWHRSGTAQPYIKPSDIKGRLVFLPPLADQKRIAQILDAADSLRSKRRESLAQLDTLLQSTFLEMFGDPVTNPMGWEVVKVDTIGSVQGGLQVTTKRRSLPIEHPYLRVANVFRGYLDLSEVKTIRMTEAEERRTVLEDQDILIVEGHGNREEIGRCSRWDNSIRPCVHQNHLIRLRCYREKVDPVFVEYYINSPGGRRELTGTSRTTSGLNTISVSKVRAANIKHPPIDLQRRFAAFVESVERQKARMRAHLTELDALFASLQSRAFNGEL